MTLRMKGSKRVNTLSFTNRASVAESGLLEDAIKELKKDLKIQWRTLQRDNGVLAANQGNNTVISKYQSKLDRKFNLHSRLECTKWSLWPNRSQLGHDS